MSLSELIENEVREGRLKEEEGIGIYIKTPGHLDLSISTYNRDNDRKYIWFNGSFGGPEGLSKWNSMEHVAQYMLAFLKEMNLGKLDFSFLNVELKNGQSMDIDHDFVHKTGQNFYELDLYYLDNMPNSRAMMPVLSRIAKQAYGLILNETLDEFEHNELFKGNTPEQGVAASIRAGLKHGTYYQEKLRSALQRLRNHLLESELKAIQDNSPELLEDRPKKSYVHANIIQNWMPPLASSFIELLEKLPDEVNNINFFLNSGEMHVGMTNKLHPSYKSVPDIQVAFAEKNRARINEVIDKMWNHYRSLTGATLDHAIEAIRNPPED